MVVDNKLNEIIDNYWNDFQEKKDRDFVVKPSIPIIWFGDLDAYKNSTKRILTVALNPSDLEFKKDKNDNKTSLFRFLDAKDITDDNYKSKLCSALNNYFKTEPYAPWFNNFEKILNTIGATYGGKLNHCNTSYNLQSIHIDIFTPLATSPTWGKLGNDAQQNIKNIELFKSLLNYLEPEIILISVARKHIIDVFELKEIPAVAYSYKNGIKIEAFKTTINKKDTIILYGKNQQGTPFGGMTDDWKEYHIPQLLDNVSRIDAGYKEFLKSRG